ncbi:MAG TPA: hypothetical protein PKW80_10875 [Bacteroidales bacterium]|nr:hypothetical protein [Bacteroidales bacterium]
MKTKIHLLFLLLAASMMMFSSCKKDNHELEIIPAGPPYGPVTPSSMAGLGSHPGYPTGTQYTLPSNIIIIGDIRGGLENKGYDIDKNKYDGPFPYIQHNKAWIDYGTGTFVNLYIKFFNALPTPSTVVIPGGLIFVDSADINEHVGVYQKGYILQSDTIPVPALDTAFACIRAYCLNASLLPSSYDAVYYIGPITNNPQLNQITTIMAPKQYPFGEEYDIQHIIWNVTDHGLTLTAAEIQYLNSLP